MRILTTRFSTIGHLAFSHDGRELLAAQEYPLYHPSHVDRGGIDIWDLSGAPEPAETIFQGSRILGFTVNPAGRWLYIAAADRAAFLPYVAFDRTTRESFDLGLVGRFGFRLQTSLDGTSVLGFGVRPGPLFQSDWRVARWRQDLSAPPAIDWEQSLRPDYPPYMAFDSITGRFIGEPFWNRTQSVDRAWTLRVRSATDGRTLDRVTVPNRTIDQVLFNPNGSSLVVRSGMSLLVWDAHDFSRKPHKVKNTSRLHFTACAFHPSGRYLAATSNDASVKLFDATTCTVAAFNWEVGRVRSLAFSPDGMLAAGGGDNGQIVVWDVDV